MQAIRQIVNVKNKRLSIDLPADFTADIVEVIVLPVEEQKTQSKIKNSERFSGAISVKTAEKIHKHINEVRSEWERDTF